MADVKWIKITTDMFDNKKIKYLRKLPDGNNIVLIWVMLLTMAGRCNSGGMVFLTENIPYTPKMLADELDFEENTVVLALQALQNLNMIVADSNFFAITGWEEHQNVDGMERIREQNRKRVARFREKQKLIQSNVSCNSDVTLRNDIDIDIDKEEDKDNNNIGQKRSRFMPPTLIEVQSYCNERGNKVDADCFINHYEANGWMVGKNKMKDWKAAVRTWERNLASTAVSNKANATQSNNYTERQYTDDFLNGLYKK